MGTKSLFLTLSCAAALAVPAGAQTASLAESGNKGHRFSPALQKKMTERTAALRANADASVGPLFDRSSKSWTIETADCPLVKSQLKGAGFKGHTVWVSMNDDGTFHVQIRTEASGTAVDAGGNKYLFIYDALAELDTPDPSADSPMVTGYGPSTFQLIPVTAGGAGYMVAQYIQGDTPTPLNAIPASAVTSTAPQGCEPL